MAIFVCRMRESFPRLSGRWLQAGVMGWLLAGCCAAAGAQAWNLQWSDEFNGGAKSAPDAANWNYDTGASGWGNGELEMYCAPGSDKPPCSAQEPNIYQDGSGHLVIRAVKTDGGWTSGRLKTAGKQQFQYGRIEARMKLQVGDGFWPAFWMLGSDIGKVGWPASGEQDIIEWVQSYGPGVTSSTVHGPGYSGGKGIGRRFSFPGGGRIDDDSYHTYGVVWSEDRMQFYRDNPAEPFLTITPANLPSGAQWVYNSPFFLLLNFAIGGPTSHFSGTTDDSTPGVGTMLVDYVRVYRASNAVDPGKWYTLQSKSTGACLEAGKSTAVALKTCLGGKNGHQWEFKAAHAGLYSIASRDGGELSPVKRRPVLLKRGAQVRAADREWTVESLKDGTYRIVSKTSGLCVDAGQGVASGSAAMGESACNGSSSQAFVLTEQP